MTPLFRGASNKTHTMAQGHAAPDGCTRADRTSPRARSRSSASQCTPCWAGSCAAHPPTPRRGDRRSIGASAAGHAVRSKLGSARPGLVKNACGACRSFPGPAVRASLEHPAGAWIGATVSAPSLEQLLELSRRRVGEKRAHAAKRISGPVRLNAGKRSCGRRPSVATERKRIVPALRRLWRPAGGGRRIESCFAHRRRWSRGW